MDFDTSTQQYDRDLRGPSVDHKRHKDATTKWALGEMPLAGVRGYQESTLLAGSDIPQEDDIDINNKKKVRPLRFNPLPSYYKPHHNIIKPGRAGGNQWQPSTRVRSRVGVAEEILAADRGMEEAKDLPSPVGGVSNDPFLYSFDSIVTPGAPLSLDVFVKQPTGRDTERLVEKEYEVVDENGLALKGKERKGNLRKAGSGLEESPRVDDGFEIV